MLVGAVVALLVAGPAAAQGSEGLVDSLAAPQTPIDAVQVDSSGVVARKALSPRDALLRSALLPGWGQVSTGHPVKAILFGGAAAGALAAAVVEGQRVGDAADPEAQAGKRNTRVLYYFITVTLAALDAYVDAHLDDFEIEPPSPAGFEGARLTVRFDW
jgi:hypothetical protein